MDGQTVTVSAIVTAGAMVKAGLYQRVAVVGGGSLAKLGMKAQAFLEREMPILDDCLASMAVLITNDDGVSPVIRLEPGAVGGSVNVRPLVSWALT